MAIKSKTILVSLLVFASLFVFAANVSAADIASSYNVEVEGSDPYTNNVSVTAGETITVKVYFEAIEDDTDVIVEAEIDGEKTDVKAATNPFDVEDSKTYRKVLELKVPYELKDELSDDVTLNIEINGKEYKTKLPEITLRVQRPSYNTDIKSVTVSDTVEAGETLPVDIVLKNTGYNDLNDLYVTASINEAGIKKTAYFGDIVSLECDTDDPACPNDDSDEDTVNGRIYLSVPYGVKAGIYTLEIKVANDDTVDSVVKQIVVKNEFVSNLIASSSKKTAAPGQDAEYTLLLVNPTDKLKVYRIITESTDEVSSSSEESVVAITAGSSKTIKITANAVSGGEHDFNVNALSGEDIAGTVTLTLDAKGNAITNAGGKSPIVVLTVILAIIFLVLLVVLIVLIGKKPEKSEEFGESYY